MTTRFFRISALVVLFLSIGLNIEAQQVVNAYAKNDLGDILLMYYGQKGRLKWNVNQVSCAVTHTFADGHTDWLFPTFLYLEFRRGNKMLGNGHPVAKEPSLQEDWQWLIDRFFTKDEGLDALDQAIEQAKTRLGPPPFKHQVILTIPVPVKTQGYWGTINGKVINFERENDRFEAVKWYVDNIEKRFKQQQYRNISLVGYHWLDEYAAPSKAYMPRVAKYLHHLGRKFVWNPMSRADYRFKWKQLDVDYAFLQVGYFWNFKSSPEAIAAQLDRAKTYGLGLVFEVNESLNKDHDKYFPRFKTLVDVYEQKGAFAQSAITYYFSNNALYDFKKSSRSEDVALMDRLARFIVQRNRRFAASPNPSTPATSTTKSGTSARDRDKLDWRDPEYWHF